ncbi:MAG: TRAP transporter substrate-binding protein [Deltaproteobacteria bacterium]|nr:TRAP transporter substrate-binding protein [Deltaproteobacteria bacterium]
MKKVRFLKWLLSVCLVLLWTAPSMAQVITLRLADQNPATGWGPVHAMQPWAKKVEEATKGKVKIDIFASQTLAKGPDIRNAVKSGVADIGFCFHGYWPDLTPLYDVVTLPSLPPRSAEKGSEMAWKLYEKFPAMQKEFSDVKLLNLWTSPPRFILTTKKQVKTLEDLKGLKIRISGGPPTEQMKAFGAVPVLMPGTEIYQALEKGVLDGTDASWEAIQSFRFYEVAKYYTFTSLSSTNFSLVMNKDKWESLPKDVQAAIMSVSGLEGSKFFGKNWYDTVETSAIADIKKGGHQMITYTMPKAENDRLRKATEFIWSSWVKKLEAKGIKDAQPVLNAYMDMLK